MNTPNNNIDFVPENTLDPAAGVNIAIDHIDALLQLSVIGIENTPPAAPNDGDRYIIGTGAGDWVGEDNKIARYIADGDYWQFFNASLCINQADESLYGFFAGQWKVLAAAN